MDDDDGSIGTSCSRGILNTAYGLYVEELAGCVIRVRVAYVAELASEVKM